MSFKIDAQKFSVELDALAQNKSIINNSYLISYQYFVDYFKERNTIEKKDVIIGAHFVYGWMPTILHLDSASIRKVTVLLNKVKRDESLSPQELGSIKSCINNSLVGTSKLLHFVNPNNYAIWDRNIMAYFSPRKTAYGIDKIEYYLQYLKELKFFAASRGFKQLKPKIETLCNPVSDLRAIEFILFESVHLLKTVSKSAPK